MLMPKKNRTLIYEHLFKEGVMVAQKDFRAPSHPELKEIPNLHVIKALQSLASRGMVKEQFAWQHYYWYLTNEGIQYLREFLHYPAEVVPATLKRAVRAEGIRPARGLESNKGDTGPESDRRDYRRGFGQQDKVGEAGPGGAPMEFRGGFGRGGGAPM